MPPAEAAEIRERPAHIIFLREEKTLIAALLELKECL
jgi:hypothetical protein